MVVGLSESVLEELSQKQSLKKTIQNQRSKDYPNLNDIKESKIKGNNHMIIIKRYQYNVISSVLSWLY